MVSAREWDSGRCGEEGVEWRKGISLFTSFSFTLFELFAISMYLIIRGKRWLIKKLRNFDD